MNITEYKGFLENLVHDSLYILDKPSEEDKKTLKDIINYLYDSEDYFNDFRILIASRNNENYFAYDEYIEMFLKEAKFELRTEILLNY